MSAIFAALTAIFAKIGVENINSDFATFIRTIVILITLAFILAATGQFQAPGSVSGRTYLFLVLSGLATGGSWICYFRALKIGQAAQVAPIDKRSVVLVAIFGVVFLGERLTAPNWLGRGADRRRRGAGGVSLKLISSRSGQISSAMSDLIALAANDVGGTAVAVAFVGLGKATPIERAGKLLIEFQRRVLVLDGSWPSLR